ncbi:MAG: metal ABC transporter permease [Prevotella sp.]
MFDILQYTFFQNALLGGLLASVVCGLVGTYIVTRRLVFISGGITHASFGGVGLGVYLGINPILSAMAFAIASACGVQWMSSKRTVREDSAIALFWTLGMSVGIICSFLTPGFMPDLTSFLFGNILTIDAPDLLLLALLAVVVVGLFAFFADTIMSVAFDPTFARTQNMPVRRIEYLMMTLIAMTIVATLRLVGIVLAISLLTIPQMTANIFVSRFRQMAWLSVVFAAIYCVIGLVVSYLLNVPSGASIIFVSIVVYGILKKVGGRKIT